MGRCGGRLQQYYTAFSYVDMLIRGHSSSFQILFFYFVYYGLSEIFQNLK